MNGKRQRMNNELLSALGKTVAQGHYICLCSRDSNNEFSACINAGRVPASKNRSTRFYYHRSPVEAINLAMADHRQQIEAKDTTSCQNSHCRAMEK